MCLNQPSSMSFSALTPRSHTYTGIQMHNDIYPIHLPHSFKRCTVHTRISVQRTNTHSSRSIAEPLSTRAFIQSAAAATAAPFPSLPQIRYHHCFRLQKRKNLKNKMDPRIAAAINNLSVDNPQNVDDLIAFVSFHSYLWICLCCLSEQKKNFVRSCMVKLTVSPRASWIAPSSSMNELLIRGAVQQIYRYRWANRWNH